MRRFEFISIETPATVPAETATSQPEMSPIEMPSSLETTEATVIESTEATVIESTVEIGTVDIPAPEPFAMPTRPSFPPPPTTTETMPPVEEHSSFATPPESITAMPNPPAPESVIAPESISALEAEKIAEPLSVMPLPSLPIDRLPQRMRVAVVLSICLNATFLFGASTWMAGRFLEPEKEKVRTFVEVSLEDKSQTENNQARGPQVRIPHAGNGKTRPAPSRKISLVKTRPMMPTPNKAVVKPVLLKTLPVPTQTGTYKPALAVPNTSKPAEVTPPKQKASVTDPVKPSLDVPSQPNSPSTPDKNQGDKNSLGETLGGTKSGISGGEGGNGQESNSFSGDPSRHVDKEIGTKLITRPAMLLQEERNKEIPALPRLDLPPLPDVFKTADFNPILEQDVTFTIAPDGNIKIELVMPSENKALNAWLLDLLGKWRAKVALKDSKAEESILKKRIKILFGTENTQMTELPLLIVPENPPPTPEPTPVPPVKNPV
jgi:hypothetical protein